MAPPCMMLKPEEERLVADLGGRAKAALIDVDDEPELAGTLHVSSIPALTVVTRGPWAFQRESTTCAAAPSGRTIEPHTWILSGRG